MSCDCRSPPSAAPPYSKRRNVVWCAKQFLADLLVLQITMSCEWNDKGSDSLQEMIETSEDCIGNASSAPHAPIPCRKNLPLAASWEGPAHLEKSPAARSGTIACIEQPAEACPCQSNRSSAFRPTILCRLANGESAGSACCPFACGSAWCAVQFIQPQQFQVRNSQ